MPWRVKAPRIELDDRSNWNRRKRQLSVVAGPRNQRQSTPRHTFAGDLVLARNPSTHAKAVAHKAPAAPQAHPRCWRAMAEYDPVAQSREPVTA